MPKIAPKEARAILVAASLIKPDASFRLTTLRRVMDAEVSRQNAIEERKRMFKQATDNKK